MQVYHFHAQKTGGTSVNHAVFALAYDPADFPNGVGDLHPGRAVKRACSRSEDRMWSGNGFTVAQYGSSAIAEGRFDYAHDHATWDRVKLPAHTFRFTILRDPLERLVSRFRMACDLHASGQLGHYRWEGAAPYCEQADLIGFASSFLPKEDRLHQLYLFSRFGDIEEAAERIASLDFVLRFETLALDFAALCGRVGWRGLSLPHSKMGRTRIEYSDAACALLREMQEPEYRLLEQVQARRAAVERQSNIRM